MDFIVFNAVDVKWTQCCYDSNMIAMEKQTNTGKLLVAILAMILVAVGAAAVFSDNVQAAETGTGTPTNGISATNFLNLADDNGVITLQDDVVLGESVNLNESLTIVLNGHTLSSTSSVKNMFYNEGENASAGVHEVDLTINGEKAGSAINADHRIVFFRAANCDLTITGGQYTAGEYAFIWYGMDADSYDNEVVVTDAIVNAKDSAFWLSNKTIASASFIDCKIKTAEIGIYLGTVQNTVIENCTITTTSTDDSALEIKAGTVTITGSSITAPGFSKVDTVGSGESGGSYSAITINNGYVGPAKVDSMAVYIIDTEVVTESTTEGAKPIIVTSNSNSSVYVAWEGHTASDIATSGSKAEESITIGTIVANNADGTVDADAVNGAFTGTVTDVAIAEGTITSTTTLEVPENGTLTIGTDVVIEQGATFDVAEGGSVVIKGVADATFTVSGGTEGAKSEVTLTGATGSFTVTGGSVIITGTIEDAAITGKGTADVNIKNTTITGKVEFSGSGKVTFYNVTIAQGAEVVLGDGIEYTATGTFANNGTISGTNGIYSSSQINGLSYYVAVTTEKGGWTYYFTNVTVELSERQAVLAGTMIDSEVTVIAGNNEVTISANGDKVVYKYAYRPDFGTGLYVLGSSNSVGTVDLNNIYTDASATIVSLEDDVKVDGVVAIGDVDIGKKITVSNGDFLVVLSGTEIQFTATYVEPEKDGDKGQYDQGSIDNTGVVYIYGVIAMGSNVTANKCITGTGAVYATDVNAVQPFMATPGNLKTLSATITVENASDLIDNLGKGLGFIINKPITIDAVGEYNFDNENILFGTDNNTVGSLTITGERIIVNITESVLDQAEGNNASKIMVTNGAELNIVDSKIFMIVGSDEDKGSAITVDNADVTYDNTTSNVKVGYGTTLILSGVPTDDVEVYGTLSVTGAVTINSGITLTVYECGTLNVSGTMDVAGKLVFDAKSNVTVSGELTVSKLQGGAGIDSAGNVTVTGTMTLAAADQRYGQDNYLNITAGKFTVEGTLNLNGTFSGTILDKGTVAVDGKVGTTATIVVYDGITLNVTSVSGALTVSDNGVATAVKGKTTGSVLEGNIINVNGAENMVVTVKVATVGTGEDRKYIASMDVSGTISDATVMSTGYVYDKDYGYGLTVSGTVDLDEAALTIAGDVLVSGIVNAVTEGATITVSGELTVTGEIVAGGEDNSTNNAIKTTGNGVINATYYTVTSGPSTERVYTNHYGAFDAIVAVIDSADNKTITVSGTQEVTGEPVIASGQTVSVLRDAVLTIGSDAKLTFASGSIMSNKGEVDVDGTLRFDNFTSTYGRTATGISAEVVVYEDPARTYMSLGVAIDSGMTDITLNDNVIIKDDLTIPTGVTVTGEEKTFTIDAAENDVTLTVEGSLILVDGSQLIRNDNTVKDYETEVVVPGNMILSQPAGMSDDYLFDVEGAHFVSVYDLEDVYVVSSVEYAAANCNSGWIYITGNVSVGDVIFTADEDDGSLNIAVVDIYENGVLVKASTFVAGSVTLVAAGQSNAAMQLNTPKVGTFSGSIITEAGQVDAVRANGFSVVATIETEAEAEVDVMTIAGTIDGTATISSGEVTVASAIGGDDLTVASGATLVVPKGATLNGTYEEDAGYSITVQGTVEFDEGALSGPIAVEGTMLVSEDMNLVADVYLTGTLTVAAEKVLTIGASMAPVYGVVADGATITGTIEFNSHGYILAYPSADLSGAVIAWNNATGASDAETTDYIVNGEAYATAIAGAGTQVTYYDALSTSDVDLSGYDSVQGWYATQKDADAVADGESVKTVSGTIGTIDKVYGAANLRDVYGTISVGTGLTMYIDGLTLDNWYDNNGFFLTVGTHTVTIAANANYNADNATITFNGQTVANGGTITIGADDTTFTLSANGATAVTSGGEIVVNTGSDDMSLTDILLIVLVVLIVIMAVIVALRLMRSGGHRRTQADEELSTEPSTHKGRTQLTRKRRVTSAPALREREPTET